MSNRLQSAYTCSMNWNWCSAEIGSFGSNGASSLTASAPMSLIFSTLQPGSISAIGAPAAFFGLPDFSTRTSIPRSGGMASEAIADQAP